MPGELCVSGFVAPRSEAGRTIDTQQEIGYAAPWSIHEKGLANDLGAFAHCTLGANRIALPVDLTRYSDRHYLLAFVLQALQARLLLLETPFANDLGLR